MSHRSIHNNPSGNRNRASQLPQQNSQQGRSPQPHTIHDDEHQLFINSSSKKSIQTYRQFQKLLIDNQAQDKQQQKVNAISQFNSGKMASRSDAFDRLSDSPQKQIFLRQCKTRQYIAKYLKQYEGMMVAKKSQGYLSRRQALIGKYQKRRNIKKQNVKQQVLQRIHRQQQQQRELGWPGQSLVTSRAGGQERVKGFIQRQQFYQQQRKILCQMRQFCLYGGIQQSSYKGA